MTPRIPGQKPGGQQSLMDLLTPSLQAFVENLPILGDIVEAFTGREDGDPNDIGSKINAAKNWVAGLFGKTTSLASRVSAIEGKIATGAEFFDDFNRGDSSGALGNGWTQGGDGQPLGIRDQAAQIAQGGLIAQAGRRWAKSPKAASGNTFTVSMVTHPVAPSQYAETWLCARMNAAFTEGVAVRMVSNRAWLSRVSRSGNGWSATDIAPVSGKSYSASATVEFRGEESVLQVLIDSVVVLSATDTVHAIDVAHRENGFVEQTTTVAGGFSPSYSGGLASYSLKSVAQLASVTDTATAAANVVVAPVATQAAAASTAAATASTAAAAASADAATASGLATTATALGVAAQNQAASSAAVQNAGSALGISASVLFSGADGETLSTVDFTDDGSGNLAIRDPLGYIGIKVGAPDGVYGTRLNTPTATDNQSATIVVGDSANRDQKTRLLLRCDTGLTRGAFLEFADNSTIRLGQWTRAGGSWDFSTVWSSASVDVNTGQRVEFRAVGSVYVALVDGVPKLNYSDAGGALTVGAAFRWTGFAMQRQTINSNSGFPFFTPITNINDSYRIASLAISDMKAPGAVVGIGWKVFRSTSSGVSISSTTNGSFNNFTGRSVFDTTANVNQATVTDLGAGLITIQRSGYYSLTAAFTSPQSTGAVYHQWTLYIDGLRASAGLPASSTSFAYLSEGQTVQPGLYNNGGNTATSLNGGASNGGSCQFSGFLMQTAN